MQATLLDHDDTATTGDTTGVVPGEPVTADEWAAHLATAVPGPQTAAMLGLLEREQLSTTGRIDALKAWERHVGGVDPGAAGGSAGGYRGGCSGCEAGWDGLGGL